MAINYDPFGVKGIAGGPSSSRSYGYTDLGSYGSPTSTGATVRPKLVGGMPGFKAKIPFKEGGAVKKMAKGGTASKRADGCAQRGKTRGKMV